jgi:hypothetical protein
MYKDLKHHTLVGFKPGIFCSVARHDDYCAPPAKASAFILPFKAFAYESVLAFGTVGKCAVAGFEPTATTETI